jgi:hypothetical protein
VKILIGLLLILAGAYWIFYGSSLVTLLGVSPNTALADFLVLVNGGLPPFIALIGLFIVWLEWDEWKIERELAAEERRARRKR